MFAINLNEIGGGVVRRRFQMGGRDLVQGDKLTAEQVRSIPANNRQALLENRFIEVFRVAPASVERHVVSRGFGKYDVIEGRKINNDPLDKDDAVALARGDEVHPIEVM